MTTIRNVSIMPGYKILVVLENGHEILYDLSNRIHTLRFADLQNSAQFEKFEIIDHRMIWWSDYCHITVDEILGSIQR